MMLHESPSELVKLNCTLPHPPHLDVPVSTAGEEQVWVHAIPLDGVHRHAVPIEAGQVVAAVRSAALVHRP